MTEYVTGKHLEKVSKDNNKYRMLQWPVTNWATPIGTYQNLTRVDAEKINTLKRILNYNNCALIMHDGESDDACRINGFHIHFLVQNDNDAHLCKLSRWRIARAKLQKFCTVKTAKIVEHKDFYRHILTPPRVFMGANNVELKNRLLTVYLREQELQLYKQQLPELQLAAQLTLLQADETMSEVEESEEEGASSTFYTMLGMQPNKRKRREPEEEEPYLTRNDPHQNLYHVDPADFLAQPSPRARPTATASLEDIMKGAHAEPKMKPSRSSINIETCRQLMRKYNRSASDELYVAICRKGNDKDIFEIEQLRALPYGGKVFQQAAEDLHLLAQVADRDYVDVIIETKIPDKSLFLTYNETVNALNRWLKDQNINKFNFVKSVYKVLSKQSSKKNTIYLQGQSNAGKTWLFRSMLPDMSLVGQTSESVEFRWMTLVNKFVGLVSEMTITTVDMSNKCKEILGGEPSQVNVKNKPPVLLPRTLILLSSNALIWDHFPNEANPLRNRMFMYSGLKELKWLQECMKFPSREYWQGIFAKIRAFERDCKMNIEDIRETDLEPSLDAALHDAFKLADTITERSSAEDSQDYQCGQRIPYSSESDSEHTMPPLSMDDIRAMSDMETGGNSPPTPPTQHAPQYDEDASFLMEMTSASHVDANTSTKKPVKTEQDTTDGLFVGSNISNIKNESIVITSDSDGTPPPTIKKRRINQYFSNNKKHK
ncbi:hypothetical protein DPMN_102498 [Dreissena polymorpha]|uniref:Parvovirus non-structural protein 1 helicase domain-containing protein n=1 Tax=Dreissena polymorpha TaxID=45954 RepID=A0A9D4R9Y3_DREPO|nr:hypothetical protein DPMN_102498 [Dreissena polymorpha]